MRFQKAKAAYDQACQQMGANLFNGLFELDDNYKPLSISLMTPDSGDGENWWIVWPDGSTDDLEGSDGWNGEEAMVEAWKLHGGTHYVRLGT